MAAAPSIKGALIATLIEDAKALLARNAVRLDQLKTPLSPDTLILLEGKAEIARWYPIHIYTELTELLWHEEGGGRVGYLHQRGEAAMKRMIEQGLYQQLEFVTREAHGNLRTVPRDAIVRAVRLVGSLSGTIRNFGRDSWEWDPNNPNHLLNHIYDATHYPEVMRLVGEGALSFLLRITSPEAPPVTSRRVSPDHIVFTFDYGGVIAPEV